ncbi:spore coat U domain-containing protein [Yokenella regensburgei]|uniref:Csu type fimbrial protein n=1 Tax=Yokenella regensburgei TaxID=158877 RepID=UPI003F165CA4
MRKVFLTLVLLLISIPHARSACRANFSNASPSLGTQVSSFVLNTNEQTTTLNLLLDCDSTLTLLTNDSVTLTAISPTPFVGDRAVMRRTDATASTDAIAFRLCGLNTCSAASEISRIKGYTWTGGVLLTLLGSKRYTLPLFLRTVTGQTVSAGTYQGVMTLNLYYSICAEGVIGCATNQVGNLPLTLTVNMTVANDCTTITAPAVAFGSAPVAKSFPTISQSVGVTCTKDYAYTVGINNGLNASGNVRRMASGATNRLSYEIYKGSTTSRWGSTGSERWASAISSAVSSDGTLRTFNYTAQVLPNQITPPGGVYSDTLTIDIGL